MATATPITTPPSMNPMKRVPTGFLCKKFSFTVGAAAESPPNVLGSD
jgi:hypothetical protein